MSNQLAITKLKAILFIDLIIIALAAGGYFYVQSSFERPKSAAFVLSDLTINPSQIEAGQPVTISVNITNIGTASGEYVADLIIDDVLSQSRTVLLLALESKIIEIGGFQLTLSVDPENRGEVKINPELSEYADSAIVEIFATPERSPLQRSKE